jgi:hypothetical protein
MKNEMSIVSKQLVLLMTKTGKQKERTERKIDSVVEYDCNRMHWQY